ncbi:pyrroline-5-carboxylate reductase [Sediminihabitans luteus]|uniref:Pyrroline-5-carboxylate reductase n=1 Tax=Sediminihabitans luteus TaxID=1138585 RepID=A0A2M9CZV4_9CELL|nr:pyrroline-5-carboxylate reductase [Sediminihabitans luteus]PJJ77383.1 pyrroline-5-carboxylate reductase [Sediminihabitans luteus]GII98276.1 pyrroline-5-carboxylate reductase [Sediminihabitans luteus]
MTTVTTHGQQDDATTGAPSDQPRVAVLGTGVMGETVLTGVLAAGWDPQRVVATARRSERAAELREQHGVRTTDDNVAAAAEADVVVLGVKPKDIGALTEQIAGALRPGTLVITVAVGLSCAFYEKRLPAGTPFVRVMPNTPSSIGSGVSAISPGVAATEEHLALVETLLASTGLVIRVAEKDQDAVGALSGSGPAYVFYVLDALSEAGTLMGLPRATASRLATATVLGAARLAEETGEHPAILREKVSSPGGTTIAALRELDRGGVRAAFVDALTAAKARSTELSAQLEAE